MKKLLGFSILGVLLLFSTPIFAQAPTPICFNAKSPGGNQYCQQVDANNPFPVTATVSVGGFQPNGGYTTLTATGSSSSSTAIPTGTPTTTAVRMTNNGTAEVSCTFATGAATGLANNTQIPNGASVVRNVGSFDHVACIDQTGSASNVVVLESGIGLGVDSGGAGGGGGSSGAVFGPTAAGSAAANPPVLLGGTIDGTATGNVDNAKVAGGLLFTQTSLNAETTKVIGEVNQGTSPWVVSLNTTPSLVNGNGVVETQGGSVLSATNGIFTNLLQGNAVIASGNPLFVQLTAGSAAIGTVTANLGTLNGASTAANQATEISSLATIATNSGLASNIAAAATGGCTAQTIFSAASNNATVIGSAAAHTLCFVRWENTGTNLYSIRFYDTATAPSAGAPCNSATNLTSADVAQSNATSPGGVANNGPFGQSFASGIVVCITGANANNDNTNASTGLNLIIGYK